jgi:hypothetical protein
MDERFIGWNDCTFSQPLGSSNIDPARDADAMNACSTCDANPLQQLMQNFFAKLLDTGFFATRLSRT